MKTILTTIFLSLGFIQICSADRFTNRDLIEVSNTTKTYNYVFKVDGIDNYGYKYFIDYVQEIFGKRPEYNATTGKFHNDANEFIIMGSVVEISQTELSNKLQIAGVTLTSFNGALVSETNNEQPK